MKKVLLAGISAIVASTAALADKGTAQKDSVVLEARAEKKAVQTSSKAIRLSDAELDKVTAGGAEVIQGGGLTIVLNPGNAEILKFNKNHIVCINCL